MSYEIVLQEVSSRTLAVACAQVTAGTLQSTIGRRFDEAYQYLEVSGSIQHGLNVIVYWDETDHRLLFNQQGVRIEAGVEITAEVRKSGDIYGSATPAGLIASTVHAGPYHLLPKAHAAIRSWCAEHGRTLRGPHWEIYGHWCDDLTQLRTEVCYLLE